MILRIALIVLLVLGAAVAFAVLTSPLFWFGLLAAVGLVLCWKALRRRQKRRQSPEGRLAEVADAIDDRLDRLEDAMDRVSRRLRRAMRQ